MYCVYFYRTIDISGCHRDITGLGIKTLGVCPSLTSLDISYLYKVPGLFVYSVHYIILDLLGLIVYSVYSNTASVV
jgi:hypothetical protein